MILQPQFAFGGLGPISGFNFYTPFTIAGGQVPSTQTDFPILISVTDNRFKTVANGGHVVNANGYDIRPYSDSGITTAITGYELVFYDAVNGIIEMWVKRSSVDDGLITYLAYGNSALTTDGSSTSTWSNAFTNIYHFKDGTTLSVADSTGNNNGTNINTVTATTGKIDGAAGFASASSQTIDSNTNAATAALTWSAWVKATTLPDTYNSVFFKNVANVSYTGIQVKSDGTLFVAVKATVELSYDGTGSHTLSTGTWYLLTLSYDITAGLTAYVNAGSDGTVAANGDGLTVFATHVLIGSDAINNRYWNGVIDEVRLSNTVRSANWITTEYNNQSAPGTFLTMGAEA